MMHYHLPRAIPSTSEHTSGKETPPIRKVNGSDSASAPFSAEKDKGERDREKHKPKRKDRRDHDRAIGPARMRMLTLVVRGRTMPRRQRRRHLPNPKWTRRVHLPQVPIPARRAHAPRAQVPARQPPASRVDIPGRCSCAYKALQMR